MSKPHNMNPLTAAEKQALDTFAKIAKRLGFNPTSGELARELDITPTMAASLIGRLRDKGKLVRNGAGWRKTGVVK
jgi:phage terminase small subunit